MENILGRPAASTVEVQTDARQIHGILDIARVAFGVRVAAGICDSRVEFHDEFGNAHTWLFDVRDVAVERPIWCAN